MIKFFKIILFLLFVVTSVSCKKQPKNHKIKYTITFHQVPEYGFTNWMVLNVTPAYVGDYNYDPQNPAINYEMAKTGEWNYEYWELQNGNEVNFSLFTAEKYYYTIKVYVDNSEVAYKKIYSGTVIESSGLGAGDNLEIKFIYQE